MNLTMTYVCRIFFACFIYHRMWHPGQTETKFLSFHFCAVSWLPMCDFRPLQFFLNYNFVTFGALQRDTTCIPNYSAPEVFYVHWKCVRALLIIYSKVFLKFVYKVFQAEISLLQVLKVYGFFKTHYKRFFCVHCAWSLRLVFLSGLFCPDTQISRYHCD